jgi:hypothetical protein
MDRRRGIKMIWKASKKPNVGDNRLENRFSFFPTKICDRWYWLEFYVVEQLYISRNDDYWVDSKYYFCGELIKDRNIPAILHHHPFKNTLKSIKEFKELK